MYSAVSFMSLVQIENEDELKRKFALALLKHPGNPFQAGIEVFGTDTGKALFVGSNWLNDPIVEEEKARLLEDGGEMALLPSKSDLARKVWEMATCDEGEGSKRIDFEDKLKAFRFYAELREFIKKPGESTSEGSGNTNVQNNVMVVHQHGTNEEWSDALREQQRKLLADAAKPHASSTH